MCFGSRKKKRSGKSYKAPKPCKPHKKQSPPKRSQEKPHHARGKSIHAGHAAPVHKSKGKIKTPSTPARSANKRFPPPGSVPPRKPVPQRKPLPPKQRGYVDRRGPPALAPGVLQSQGLPPPPPPKHQHLPPSARPGPTKRSEALAPPKPRLFVNTNLPPPAPPTAPPNQPLPSLPSQSRLFVDKRYPPPPSAPPKRPLPQLPSKGRMVRVDGDVRFPAPQVMPPDPALHPGCQPIHGFIVDASFPGPPRSPPNRALPPVPQWQQQSLSGSFNLGQNLGRRRELAPQPLRIDKLTPEPLRIVKLTPEPLRINKTSRG